MLRRLPQSYRVLFVSLTVFSDTLGTPDQGHSVVIGAELLESDSGDLFWNAWTLS